MGKLKSANLVAQLDQQIKQAAESANKSLAADPRMIANLAIVEVGADPASRVYIKQKLTKAQALGLTAVPFYLPADISQTKLNSTLEHLNTMFPAIILQAPLPKHLDFEQAVTHIDPQHDADGLNPINQASLLSDPRGQYPVACTPQGICLWLTQILHTSSLEDAVDGKRVLVIGRSSLVGMPVALLLQNANATVTVWHSHSPQLTPADLQQYDIIIAAAGQHRMIKTSDLADGTVAIDVGIHAVPDTAKKSGHRLEGDVEISDPADLNRLDVTAVPGGVGPLTVEMLMLQAVALTELNCNPDQSVYQPTATLKMLQAAADTASSAAVKKFAQDQIDRTKEVTKR